MTVQPAMYTLIQTCRLASRTSNTSTKPSSTACSIYLRRDGLRPVPAMRSACQRPACPGGADQRDGRARPRLFYRRGDRPLLVSAAMALTGPQGLFHVIAVLAAGVFGFRLWRRMVGNRVPAAMQQAYQAPPRTTPFTVEPIAGQSAPEGDAAHNAISRFAIAADRRLGAAMLKSQRMFVIGGGFNGSPQHARRTFQPVSDTSRSFWGAR